MGLMSQSLLWLLGLLTVGLPVLSVVFWRRIPGRRPWPQLGRLGLVVASQVAAVMLVATALNDYGYFYSSWGELSNGVAQAVGGVPTPRLEFHGGTRGAAGAVPLVSTGFVRVTTYPGFSTRNQWRVRGRLEKVTIAGPVTELTSPADVYLPPQYFQPGYEHKRFPVVLALTGWPGTARNLVVRMRYQDILLREIRRHEARPMVLVMLQPAVTYPRDTECTDVPGGPQVQTFLSQDVPTEISHRYRVAPNGWGVIGNSTGGFCAVKLAMTNPTTFPVAASLSGYYHSYQDATTGSLFGGSAVVSNLNSPEWRLAHLPAPPVSLFVTSSDGEPGPFGVADMLRFVRMVRPPMQVTSVVVPHGGHTFSTWEPQVPPALRWLSTRLTSSDGIRVPTPVAARTRVRLLRTTGPVRLPRTATAPRRHR